MPINSPHTFHIPVMGLAYTVDSPVKVARFGIASVVSIIEDNLIERMREHYYRQRGEPYVAISRKEPDYRARRITDYLNLLDRIVAGQMERLRAEPFVEGSEITRYFEMLPDDSAVRKAYQQMLLTKDPAGRARQEARLRNQVVPGSIDVNIMTKLDNNQVDSAGAVVEDGSDAVAALRGYVRSSLDNSGVVLSAGMNPRLFAFMERTPELDVSHEGEFRKKIIVKVSDFRSALIQGKMLAKKGLWVSEFRIESGLNCGGHAFASDGYLLGPILEEFKSKRGELVDSLFALYNEARAARGKAIVDRPHRLRITVQGGIGTHSEDRLLRDYYGVDGTGWGTPFLLVPEATTVDEETLQRLCQAREKDVTLSHYSPLGVRFHYLKGTSAEQEKLERVRKGRPWSPCTEKFLVSSAEFGPALLCTASRSYQAQKIQQLKDQRLPIEEYSKRVDEVLCKECLCTGLSNAAIRTYDLKPLRKGSSAINICPGPNIAYFDKVVSLREMIDHIYGRTDVILRKDRPHMFIKELTLYVDYWREMIGEASATMDARRRNYIMGFQTNIRDGIAYYRSLSALATHEWSALKSVLSEGLAAAENQLDEALARFVGEPASAIP